MVWIGKTLNILKLTCDDNAIQLYIDLTKLNSNFKDNIERLFKEFLFSFDRLLYDIELNKNIIKKFEINENNIFYILIVFIQNYKFLFKSQIFYIYR